MRNGCLVVFALPALRVNELASERVDWPNSVAKNKQCSLCGISGGGNGASTTCSDSYRHDQEKQNNAPKECLSPADRMMHHAHFRLKLCRLRHHANSRLRDEKREQIYHKTQSLCWGMPDGRL